MSGYVCQDMSKSSEQLPQHSIWIYRTTLTTPCSGVLCLLQDIEHVHVLSQIQNTMNKSKNKQFKTNILKNTKLRHIENSTISGFVRMHSNTLCTNLLSQVATNMSAGLAVMAHTGQVLPATLPAQEIWDQGVYGVWVCHYHVLTRVVKRDVVKMANFILPICNVPNSFSNFAWISLGRKLSSGHSHHLLLKAAIPLLISRYASHARHSTCKIIKSSETLLYLYLRITVRNFNQTQFLSDDIDKCKPTIASWAFLMDSQALKGLKFYIDIKTDWQTVQSACSARWPSGRNTANGHISPHAQACGCAGASKDLVKSTSLDSTCSTDFNRFQQSPTFHIWETCLTLCLLKCKQSTDIFI